MSPLFFRSNQTNTREFGVLIGQLTAACLAIDCGYTRILF